MAATVSSPAVTGKTHGDLRAAVGAIEASTRRGEPELGRRRLAHVCTRG